MTARSPGMASAEIAEHLPTGARNATPGEHTFSGLFRWASTTGAHSMPHPDELRYLGYVEVVRRGETATDPRYPGSVLMWKRA